jgi:hypothetical protein
MMRHVGFTSFLDLRLLFIRRARRNMALSTSYGTMAAEEPWIAAMGCGVQPWEWDCADCGHQW